MNKNTHDHDDAFMRHHGHLVFLIIDKTNISIQQDSPPAVHIKKIEQGLVPNLIKNVAIY